MREERGVLASAFAQIVLDLLAQRDIAGAAMDFEPLRLLVEPEPDDGFGREARAVLLQERDFKGEELAEGGAPVSEVLDEAAEEFFDSRGVGLADVFADRPSQEDFGLAAKGVFNRGLMKRKARESASRIQTMSFMVSASVR